MNSSIREMASYLVNTLLPHLPSWEQCVIMKYAYIRHRISYSLCVSIIVKYHLLFPFVYFLLLRRRYIIFTELWSLFFVFPKERFNSTSNFLTNESNLIRPILPSCNGH